jgi:hypothetical protein
MPDDPKSMAPALSGHRERTVELLVGHFAADRLTVDEFEQRVDLAHRATTVAELDRLTSDLLVREPLQPAGAAAAAPSAAQPDARQLLFALLGGTERTGRWRPARQITVLTVMGGAELDFRDAQLGAGETEVFFFCMMGGAHVIVPPTLAVDASGIAIMGGFEHRDAATLPVDPRAPLLKLRGFCLMGGVDIETRLPGESAKEANRRRKEEARRRRNG